MNQKVKTNYNLEQRGTNVSYVSDVYCKFSYGCCIYMHVASVLSGTTIRGTQIIIENHPVFPFKGKDQQRRDGLNSPLLGLQRDA
jgi:hypothetical protein